MENIPAEMKYRTPLGTDDIRFTSLNQIRSLKPQLVITNTGTEVIEAVRIEQRLIFLGFQGKDRREEKPWASVAPWALRQSQREEPILSRKIEPGQSAAISLTNGLVTQMMYAAIDSAGPVSRDHYGRFEIKCFARTAGTTTFDDADRFATVMMSFVWVPNGFGRAECEKFLHQHPTVVKISR